MHLSITIKLFSLSKSLHSLSSHISIHSLKISQFPSVLFLSRAGRSEQGQTRPQTADLSHDPRKRRGYGEHRRHGQSVSAVGVFPTGGSHEAQRDGR